MRNDLVQNAFTYKYEANIVGIWRTWLLQAGFLFTILLLTDRACAAATVEDTNSLLTEHRVNEVEKLPSALAREKRWQELKIGDHVFRGDRVRVKDISAADLSLESRVIRLDAGAHIELDAELYQGQKLLLNLFSQPQFTDEDFPYVTPLLRALGNPTNKVSSFLLARLSKDLREVIDNSEQIADDVDKVKAMMARDFNRILESESIYQQDRFGECNLRELTTNRLHNATISTNFVWVNRLLLEDAYPGLITQRSGHIYYKSDQPPELIAFRLPNNQIVEALATELHLGSECGDVRLTMISGQAKGEGFEIADGHQAFIPADRTIRPPEPVSLDQKQIMDIIQWTLYYPAILDLNELDLPIQDETLLRESLNKYREGNVLAALTNAMNVVRGGQGLPSSSAQVYLAAMDLAAGQVEQARGRLHALGHTSGRSDELAAALERLIAAVKFRTNSLSAEPRLASAWLAESYYQQARLAIPDQVDTSWETNFYKEFERSRDKWLQRARKAAMAALAVHWLHEASRSNHARSQDEGEKWKRESFDNFRRNPEAFLQRLRENARSSDTNVVDFGYAWVRLAELDFSFGENRKAQADLAIVTRGPQQNAAAAVLEGYLLAWQGDFSKAKAQFDRAIVLDGRSGEPWLGRGLIRIRQARTRADIREATKDLLLAAAREPQRSSFRSYLGKGLYHAATQWANLFEGVPFLNSLAQRTNDLALIKNAREELKLAKTLDRQDPTPSLYSALLEFQENQMNEPVRDLEQSKALNQNRQLYRSQLLLDQDQAVRSANLAAMYRDAGLVDTSLIEASRSVNSDYANYSAHLFLASSYDSFRDPQQFNLRYETPWLSELLVANLLKPVGAGPLSQTISQQEYSRLFEGDNAGFYSLTEYTSRGDWLEDASAYVTYGPVSASIDPYYLKQNGYRPNQDQESLALWSKLKYQITPNDSVLFQALYAKIDSGDLAQYYDPDSARTSLRVHETQQPIILTGYHRQWSPGQDTLLLLSRLNDDQTQNEANHTNVLVFKNADGSTQTNFLPAAFVTDWSYESSLDIYSAELQHIWQQDIEWGKFAGASTIAGLLGQFGKFDTQDSLSNPRGYPIFPPTLFPATLSASQSSSDFDRFSAYGYENVEFQDLGFKGSDALLTLGVSYDYLHYPVNHRISPISDEEGNRHQVSPKVGLTWAVDSHSTLRASYTRSLGGVSFDQSFRLEPTQVAGFLQSFRSIIPESVSGALAAPSFKTWGIGYDFHWNDIYSGVSGEWLQSDADKVSGAYDSILGQPVTVSELGSSIDFHERDLAIYAGYLLGDYLSFNARYSLSQADYQETFDSAAVVPAHVDNSALLHQLNLAVLFNYSTDHLFTRALGSRHGFFSLLEAVWWSQHNYDYVPAQPGDDFWQFNFYVGYRFARRAAELRVGILNLTDQDYRLNPLNYHIDPPRERTLEISFRINLDSGL